MAAPSKPGVAPIVAPPHVVAALDVLSHSRPSAQFNDYAALAGPTLTVVVEVPSAAVDAGRWSDGASLEVIADADNGDTTAMGRGRLPANGRALLRIPVTGPQPPSKVMVRVRATGESLVERLTLPTEPGKLIGDPLGYRSGPRGLSTPVGLFEFARDEKVRLDWPLLGKVDSVDARLLDRRAYQPECPDLIACLDEVEQPGRERPVLGMRSQGATRQKNQTRQADRHVSARHR